MQIKFSVTEEEKKELEKNASDLHMPVSKYIHKKLFESDPFSYPLPDKINKEDTRTMSLTLPREIIDSITKDAKEKGISRNQYMEVLLTQKERPKIIRISYAAEDELLTKLYETSRDIVAIRSQAEREGNVSAESLKKTEALLNVFLGYAKESVASLDASLRTIRTDVMNKLMRR